MGKEKKYERQKWDWFSLRLGYKQICQETFHSEVFGIILREIQCCFWTSESEDKNQKKYKSAGHQKYNPSLQEIPNWRKERNTSQLVIVNLDLLERWCWACFSSPWLPWALSPLLRYRHRTNLLVTIITLAIVESITAIRIEVVVVIRVEVLIVVFQVQLLQRPRPTLNGVAVPGPLQVRHRHTSDRRKLFSSTFNCHLTKVIICKWWMSRWSWGSTSGRSTTSSSTRSSSLLRSTSSCSPKPSSPSSSALRRPYHHHQ